ncbi:MAG: BMP family ABC transporter substrate-binding protein [Chloroflexi bacterium]|nr:BMP family ABC transporter substrate-binding protein [Chloroflexota bacterium]
MNQNKRVVLLALLTISTLVLSACAAPQPPAAETPAAPQSGLSGMKMAAVLSGPVNDGGWNTNAYQALTEARDKYGLEIAYTEYVKVEDAAQVMRDYADAGFQIIMAHGNEYSDQISEVAREYPDLYFIQTNGSEAGISNLYTVGFAIGEGGYLMGWLACKISQTGKVAFIIGEQYPAVQYQAQMVGQACADLGLQAEVLETYVGSWTDPTKTKELTKAALEQGADVIILMADSGDSGAIEAVREAYAAGNTSLRIISWVKDKNNLAPEFVLGGWTEDVAREIDATLQLIAAGKPGGHFAFGLAEGVVYPNPMYGLVPAEIESEFNQLLQDYLQDPSIFPNLEVRRDL